MAGPFTAPIIHGVPLIGAITELKRGRKERKGEEVPRADMNVPAHDHPHASGVERELALDRYSMSRSTSYGMSRE